MAQEKFVNLPDISKVYTLLFICLIFIYLIILAQDNCRQSDGKQFD